MTHHSTYFSAVWEDMRLRFVLRLNPSKAELGRLSEDEEVSFLPMEAIGEDGSVRLEATRRLGDVQSGYSYFRDGDVVVAKITPCFENGKGALMQGLLGGVGFGTTELIVARPRQERLVAEFLNWLFQSAEFRGLGEGAMYGAGGQKRVPDDFVRDFRLALPPPPEQNAIAAFLDRETGKIDALMEEQKRLIELLKEKRQAVISHAVTKGLEPDAPMKHSGVKWLGDVPEHWTIKPLKHMVSHVVDCLHTTPTYDGELLYPAIRTADVERGVLLLQQAKLVSEDVYRERIQRLKPEEGDVLYSREGERFGMAALVPSGVNLCLGQRMMMFRVQPSSAPGFLMWALNSEPIYQEVLARTAGATAPHANISDLINFRVPCPPDAEQQAIARWLDRATGQIDRLSEKANGAILLLQERRSALISAAVTGKIDVRQRAEVETAA